MTRAQERERFPALEVVRSRLRQVNTGIGVIHRAVDTYIDATDCVRHFDHTIERDDAGELDVEPGELRQGQRNAGKSAIGESRIECLSRVVLAVIAVKTGAFGDSHDHVTREADSYGGLTVGCDVQNHVDVVEFTRRIFNGAADAALTGTSIATRNKDVEAALKTADLRRRPFGFANERNSVALPIDTVESDSPHSGATHQKNRETSRNDLGNRTPRTRLLQTTVTCQTFYFFVFLRGDAFEIARTRL